MFSFSARKLSGLIDFTFACNDMLAYDVAICLNAWCFESDCSFNVTKARAFPRPPMAASARLSQAEQDALAAAGARCGAALPADAAGRFPQRARAGALVRPKDPLEYVRKLRFQQSVNSVRDYGVAAHRVSGVTSPPATVTIYTDGACSGNPGPGGWGAILKFGDVEKELKGGEAHTTNNRMELMAAISALEALKETLHGRSLYRQPICPSGHHRLDPRLEERTAGAPRTRSRSRMSSSGSGSTQRIAASTRCAGTGSRATPATTKTNAPINWREMAWRWQATEDVSLKDECIQTRAFFLSTCRRRVDAVCRGIVRTGEGSVSTESLSLRRLRPLIRSSLRLTPSHKGRRKTSRSRK